MVDKISNVKRIIFLSLTMICVFGASIYCSSAKKTTKSADDNSFVLKKSDVCLSSRWKRPKNEQDPYNTQKALGDFFATRLDWIYTDDINWIRACKNQGYSFGGTLNSILKDKNKNTRVIGRQRNKKGEKTTAPWMKNWKGIYWGCVNTPSYREVFLDKAKRYIDGGVNYIHVDDPGMNFTSFKWDGGCYCEYCVAKMKSSGLEGEAFYKESLIQFYEDFRQSINAYAEREVDLSCNNYRGTWKFPHSLFDIGICEIPVELLSNVDNLVRIFSNAEKLEKPQIITIPSENILLNRNVIATSYALGGHTIVPWDVYINKPKKKGVSRFFGKEENFADLYGFVRANSAYLDEFESGTIIGKEEQERTSFIKLAKPSNTTHLFNRDSKAKKNIKVVHIVNWDDNPTSSKVLIRKSTFTNRRPSIELRKPAKYSLSLHNQARRSNNFRKLYESKMMRLNDVSTDYWEMDIPKNIKWGILIIDSTPK